MGELRENRPEGCERDAATPLLPFQRIENLLRLLARRLFACGAKFNGRTTSGAMNTSSRLCAKGPAWCFSKIKDGSQNWIKGRIET